MVITNAITQRFASPSPGQGWRRGKIWFTQRLCETEIIVKPLKMKQ
jgi:hypothetical protein